jgi:TonB family protein
MTITRPSSAIAAGIILGSVFIGWSSADAQDVVLKRAKELYLSASYDDALAILADYKAGPTDIEADEYRAFCLLAVGKTDEATKVIEQIVAADPDFQPSDANASPRIQQMFRSVRHRILPGIVRQTYLDAKTAFDKSDLEKASREFDRVTMLLVSADVEESNQLADLQLLAKGFGELIQKQIAAATPPPVAAPPPVANPVIPDVDRIYGADDADVTPPVAISQVVPPWRPTAPPPVREVALVILIDETGSVSSVRIAGPPFPPYDAVLRQATRKWKYQPATRKGQPVKYQKAVAISLQPNGAK